MSDRIEDEGRERREFVRKSLYVAPAILTLRAYPAVAKAGSVKPEATPEPVTTKSDRFEERTQRFQEKRAEKREKFELKFGESKNGKGPKEIR
jgi:hypothetical protein